MLKTRVTLLQASPKIPLHRLICRTSFCLTTYQHSGSQGRSNLNQPCLQRVLNETNYYSGGWKRGLGPVSTTPIRRELCFTLKSLIDCTGWKNRGKKVGFGRDPISWDRVMGQGKGPVHRRPSNQFRGQEQAPRWEGGADPRDGDGHLLVGTRAAGGGKEANCPLAPNHLTPLHLKPEGTQQSPPERAANKRSQTQGLACLIYAQLWERREGGTRLSLLTQVLTCLNVFSAS